MSTKTQALARRLMADRAMLPEGKVGEFGIKHTRHRKGAKLMLVNQRVAIMTGQKYAEYTCPAATVVQSLTESDGVWMTDLPCELVQMHDELAKHARGEVLVGGLGLGIVVRMCARMPRVTGITVVENSREVADLVWPHLKDQLHGKGSLIVDDINTFTPLCNYDVALLDTWQGTGEMTWATEVVPLRRRFARKVPRVHCWQEQTMLTQITGSILRASALNPDIYLSGCCFPQYAFGMGLNELGVERQMVQLHDSDPREWMEVHKASVVNSENFDVRHWASVFMHRVGSPLWERTFGTHWDAAAARRSAS